MAKEYKCVAQAGGWAAFSAINVLPHEDDLVIVGRILLKEYSKS